MQMEPDKGKRLRSCAECASAKRSCDHGQPCGRCKQFDLVCYFTTDKRKLSKRQREIEHATELSHGVSQPLLKRANAAAFSATSSESKPVASSPVLLSNQESTRVPTATEVLQRSTDTANLALNAVCCIPAYSPLALHALPGGYVAALPPAVAEPPSEGDDPLEQAYLDMVAKNAHPMVHVIFSAPDASSIASGAFVQPKASYCNRAFCEGTGLPMPQQDKLLIMDKAQGMSSHVHPDDRREYLRCVITAVLAFQPRVRQRVRVHQTTGWTWCTEYADIRYTAHGYVKALTLMQTAMDKEPVLPYSLELVAQALMLLNDARKRAEEESTAVPSPVGAGHEGREAQSRGAGDTTSGNASQSSTAMMKACVHACDMPMQSESTDRGHLVFKACTLPPVMLLALDPSLRLRVKDVPSPPMWVMRFFAPTFLVQGKVSLVPAPLRLRPNGSAGSQQAYDRERASGEGEEHDGAGGMESTWHTRSQSRSMPDSPLTMLLGTNARDSAIGATFPWTGPLTDEGRTARSHSVSGYQHAGTGPNGGYRSDAGASTSQHYTLEFRAGSVDFSHAFLPAPGWPHGPHGPPVSHSLHMPMSMSMLGSAHGAGVKRRTPSFSIPSAGDMEWLVDGSAGALQGVATAPWDAPAYSLHPVAPVAPAAPGGPKRDTVGTVEGAGAGVTRHDFSAIGWLDDGPDLL